MELIKFVKSSEIENPDEMETTCDICGNKIKGLYNFVNAGDKVVCSDDCLRIAIGQFDHWRNGLFNRKQKGVRSRLLNNLCNKNLYDFCEMKTTNFKLKR